MTVLDDPRFNLVPSGRFRDRFGPLGRNAAFSSKKVCLVATDPACLIEVLYAISLRPDCFYVKYGMIAREGMYLGSRSLRALPGAEGTSTTDGFSTRRRRVRGISGTQRGR
jgi:hypothetical protein